MKSKFEVVFLEQAMDFMSKLDTKAKKKIYYNLDKAKLENDPKLFKKLTDDIWEFRTLYQGIQYRLFAFWDKTDKTDKRVHRLSCYSIKNLWVDHPDRLWCASRLFSMLCQPVGID